MVFDKIGTLTVRKPVVVSTVLFFRVTMKELCDMAIAIEANSENPLAKAVAEHAKVQLKKHESLADHVEDVKDFEVHPEAGVGGNVGEKIVLVGNKRLLQVHNVPINHEVEEYTSGTEKLAQTCVLVAIDGKVAGDFAVTDPVKPEAGHVIRYLQSMGIISIMVTGDNWGTTTAIGREVGINQVFAETDPIGKAGKIKKKYCVQK